MKKNTFRLVVFLGVISIIGIILVQMYWVRRAFDIKEKGFNQSLQIALKNVAQSIAEINGVMLANPNPVNRLASDYYVVNVNTYIDANLLQHYLKREFALMHIHADYEYAIYDCQTNEMVYGNYIAGNIKEKPGQEKTLPKYNAYTYYFGIRFPTVDTYLATQMDIWVFSSAILLVVVVFFGYAISVILSQERLSQIQKDFVNNMTHEFKTPIATIGVSADVLMQPAIAQEPGTIFTYSSIIKQENERLQRGVEKVLQMANLDKHKVKLKREKVDLSEIVHQVAEGFRLHLEPTQILIEEYYSENAYCEADKVHLINVIHNLLDNAFKYSGRNAQVRITVEQIDKKIYLSIADNGPGIKKEHHKKIWQKFYRVPTGNVHNVKGFGLGLNYVKYIISAHKWKIELESEEDNGTTFRLIIPSTI